VFFLVVFFLFFFLISTNIFFIFFPLPPLTPKYLQNKKLGKPNQKRQIQEEPPFWPSCHNNKKKKNENEKKTPIKQHTYTNKTNQKKQEAGRRTKLNKKKRLFRTHWHHCYWYLFQWYPLRLVLFLFDYCFVSACFELDPHRLD